MCPRTSPSKVSQSLRVFFRRVLIHTVGGGSKLVNAVTMIHHCKRMVNRCSFKFSDREFEGTAPPTGSTFASEQDNIIGFHMPK